MKDSNGRDVARLGDKTDHGGVVIQAAPKFKHLGIDVALDQHLTLCPKCSGTFPILATGSMTHKGRRVAYIGDKTACGATLTFLVRYDIEGTSQLSFQFGRVAATGYSRLVDLLEKTFQILPPIVAELGAYDYYTKDVRNPGRRVKVFPDRPGVGWMLYLPRRIEIEQVPEARMIHHVKDLNGTEGTILISEIDGPFDADNPEHVKVANAIEIRLADQDLLPRYVDLS